MTFDISFFFTFFFFSFFWRTTWGDCLQSMLFYSTVVVPTIILAAKEQYGVQDANDLISFKHPQRKQHFAQERFIHTYLSSSSLWQKTESMQHMEQDQTCDQDVFHSTEDGTLPNMRIRSHPTQSDLVQRFVSNLLHSAFHVCKLRGLWASGTKGFRTNILGSIVVVQLGPMTVFSLIPFYTKYTACERKDKSRETDNGSLVQKKRRKLHFGVWGT